MEGYFIKLAFGLFIILTCCEIFTNGIERLGKIKGFGDGVVGNIFSAVGTCLPETLIPVLSIFVAENGKRSIEIGIGAIAGAPFMLSTLAFFITGLSVLIFLKRRKTGSQMFICKKTLRKDLAFFIAAYTAGISACFIRKEDIRDMVAFLLIAGYAFYIFITIKMDVISHGKVSPLHFEKYLKLPPTAGTAVFQVFLSLVGIFAGARVFINCIEGIAVYYRISPMVLSLLVTPVATELPEKFNSIIWIIKKKDNLAIGNITGAMVFQSCIPVSIGILATEWQAAPEILASSVLSLMSASFILLYTLNKKGFTYYPLLTGGIFYMAFIFLVYVNTV